MKKSFVFILLGILYLPNVYAESEIVIQGSSQILKIENFDKKNHAWDYWCCYVDTHLYKDLDFFLSNSLFFIKKMDFLIKNQKSSSIMKNSLSEKFYIIEELYK